MLGIVASAFDLEAKAMIDGGYNPALGNSYYDYAAGAVQFLINYGIRPSTKGLYYEVGSVNCPAGAVSEDYAWCTGNGSPGDPGPSRILSAEAVRGMMFSWFDYSHNPNVSAAVDVLVNAQWAKPGTCPQGSAVCVPDGYYMTEYDPGGFWVSGAPPGGKNPKWFGMPFGLNPQPSWPAVRLGGARLSDH
jgi:hypothetical protein